MSLILPISVASSKSVNLYFSKEPTNLLSKLSVSSIPVKPSQLSTTTLFELQCSSIQHPRLISSLFGESEIRSATPIVFAHPFSRPHRVNIDGDIKYYIRSIPHVYVVGQTYPQTEVPGPHSRKITTLQKNRLMTIAFKLVQKNKDNRIKVFRLTRYFPDHNDLQMRQKLKVRPLFLLVSYVSSVADHRSQS